MRPQTRLLISLLMITKCRKRMILIFLPATFLYTNSNMMNSISTQKFEVIRYFRLLRGTSIITCPTIRMSITSLRRTTITTTFKANGLRIRSTLNSRLSNVYYNFLRRLRNCKLLFQTSQTIRTIYNIVIDEDFLNTSIILRFMLEVRVSFLLEGLFRSFKRINDMVS